MTRKKKWFNQVIQAILWLIIIYIQLSIRLKIYKNYIPNKSKYPVCYDLHYKL